ncbi:predicted protein [Brachyspira sp. CAG:484]|nr:predicted protein [Brachyspira sp. CAG:484]DAY63861.1 MAG TPA: tail collar domain [Caudoviricetes sp.]
MTVTLNNNPYNIVINKNMPRIGDPIITLSDILEENEIWLEGATVLRIDYPKLYIVYGTTYGAGDGSTTFGLPDCTDRTFWGANSFGYLEAGLPNIKGTIGGDEFPNGSDIHTGCFYDAGRYGDTTAGNGHGSLILGFNASLSDPIYSDEVKTVQTPSVKVRVKTRYK